MFHVDIVEDATMGHFVSCHFVLDRSFLLFQVDFRDLLLGDQVGDIVE
jgi:hypothetical protein